MSAPTSASVMSQPQPSPPPQQTQSFSPTVSKNSTNDAATNTTTTNNNNSKATPQGPTTSNIALSKRLGLKPRRPTSLSDNSLHFNSNSLIILDRHNMNLEDSNEEIFEYSSNRDLNNKPNERHFFRRPMSPTSPRSRTLSDYGGLQNRARLVTRTVNQRQQQQKKTALFSPSSFSAVTSHLSSMSTSITTQRLDASATFSATKRRQSWPTSPLDNLSDTSLSGMGKTKPQLPENADHHLASLFNHVDSWDFDVLELSNLTKGKPLSSLAYYLFERYNLIDELNIDPLKLRLFLRRVEDTYRSTNPFHNSIHASDVTHAVHFVIISSGLQDIFTPIEVAVVLLSAAMHDADHPGYNNSFLAKSQDVLHKIHGAESTLEQHHLKTAFTIMGQDDSNILCSFNECEQKTIKKMFSSLILATDIARHKHFMEIFEKRLAKDEFNYNEREDRITLMQLILKCADINNTARSPHLSHEWTSMVMSEFFLQGDKEKAFDMPVSMFMDRKSTSIPQCQVGFISYFVRPMFAVLHGLLENGATSGMLANIEENRDHWQKRIDEDAAKAADQE